MHVSFGAVLQSAESASTEHRANMDAFHQNIQYSSAFRVSLCNLMRIHNFTDKAKSDTIIMALIIILRELIASLDIARCIFEFSRFARMTSSNYRHCIYQLRQFIIKSFNDHRARMCVCYPRFSRNLILRTTFAVFKIIRAPISNVQNKRRYSNENCYALMRRMRIAFYFSYSVFRYMNFPN